MSLLDSLGSLFFAAAILTALVLYLWLPYMAWSATRNIRGIRQQLERLNETLESKGSGARVGPLGI